MPSTVETPKRPIIYSVTEGGEWAPIYSQGDYDVFVGALEATELPVYVVMNRDTKVVEFTHAVTLGYREWLNHIAPIETPTDQLPLSLSGLRNN